MSEYEATSSEFGNNTWTSFVHVLFLASGRKITVESASTESANGAGHYVGNPYGDGALLVYNSYHECLDGGLPEGCVSGRRVWPGGP